MRKWKETIPSPVFVYDSLFVIKVDDGNYRSQGSGKLELRDEKSERARVKEREKICFLCLCFACCSSFLRHHETSFGNENLN